jgi:hypothetical protein
LRLPVRLRRITPEQGKQEVKLSIVVPCFNSPLTKSAMGDSLPL